MDSTAITTGLAARPRRMFRRVIKWALVALGALFIIGAMSNLTGANDPESATAADALNRTPEPDACSPHTRADRPHPSRP